MSVRHRLLPVAVAGAMAIGTGVIAQIPSPAATRQDQTPTFRSVVKLIDIDVYVTDKNGRFVKDLTKDDFEIVEDAKAQTIQAFTFVDLPTPLATAPAPRVSIEPDVTTNQNTEGRLYVIVMDSPSTYNASGAVAGVAYATFAQRVANRFVADFLQPGDLAAVVHTQGTFNDSQSFTSSKERLRSSIERYGQGLSGDIEVTAPEMVRRHLDTYRTLEDVANRLGAITGRRKAILWIGAQLRFEVPECDPRAVGPKVGLAGLECQLNLRWGPIQNAHRDAMAAANRNNVAIYAIDPSGLTPELGRQEMDRRAALQVVAEDTGGLSVVGTNNFTGGFTNIVRDNSTYYVLGYSPTTEYRDGKFHAVKVRVKRPGVYTVRSRKGYTAPAPETRVAEGVPPPAGASAAARDALHLPIPTKGLVVSLFTAPFKGSAREHSVVIGGEVSGELLLDGKREVALSYQVFTLENHVQVGEYKTFALTLQPDTRANVQAHGLHFVDRLSLPPGRYEIRYVVDQPGGSVGSVVAPIVVPKFDEALALSGVVLASNSTAENFTVHDVAEVRERLGADPTSVRTFPRGDTLSAFVEVYSDDERLTADDLDMTGRLTDAKGIELAREEGRLRSQEKLSDRRWSYTVSLGLGDIPAGSYLLTIEASSRRRKDPVHRTIPIAIVDR
jgi:VWFA-related protein